MTALSLSPGIPVLRSFAEQKAKEFYIEFLGMRLVWEHRFEGDLPLYMAVSRDRFTLHISEHHGDATPGSTVFVPVRDVAALHSELIAKNAPFCRPAVEDLPWGRQMTVTDPFGNKLRFCEQTLNATQTQHDSR